MKNAIARPRPSPAEAAVLWSLASAKLLIHLCTNAFASYGIFRDELYYLACSHRLDFGYVDHPPLSIFVLFISRLLFGESLFALRLLPAVAGALTVLFAGLIARRLGGGVTAILLAGLALIVAPIHLAMNTVFSMNAIDLLLWIVAAYVLLSIIEDGRPRLWVALGIVMGLGLLNKISMVWFGAGLFAALLVTPLRAHLRTRWPYVAGLVSLVLFLPYVVWNIRHDLAHLEFIHNATTRKYASVSPADFILGQFFVMHPLGLLLCAAGLYLLLFAARGRPFRTLGWIFVTTFLILVINGHSKPEYLSPTYALVFAAGGVQFEHWFRMRFLKWLRVAFPALMAIAGALWAPLTLPVLPVDTFIRYAQKLGVSFESAESHELYELHQFYADMFGWENLARTVSEVYTALPPQERERTIIVAGNYGEAGAIEYFSRKYDLPPVISPHNNYWIWGWRHRQGDYRTVIILGGDREEHLRRAEEVEQAATVRCRYCIPYENDLPVFVVHGLKRDFDYIWNSIKIFI
jgi:hypothetical protein